MQFSIAYVSQKGGLFRCNTSRINDSVENTKVSYGIRNHLYSLTKPSSQSSSKRQIGSNELEKTYFRTHKSIQTKPRSGENAKFDFQNGPRKCHKLVKNTLKTVKNLSPHQTCERKVNTWRGNPKPVWPNSMSTYSRGVSVNKTENLITPQEISYTRMKAQIQLEEAKKFRKALDDLSSTDHHNEIGICSLNRPVNQDCNDSFTEFDNRSRYSPTSEEVIDPVDNISTTTYCGQSPFDDDFNPSFHLQNDNLHSDVTMDSSVVKQIHNHHPDVPEVLTEEDTNGNYFCPITESVWKKEFQDFSPQNQFEFSFPVTFEEDDAEKSTMLSNCSATSNRNAYVNPLAEGEVTRNCNSVRSSTIDSNKRSLHTIKSTKSAIHFLIDKKAPTDVYFV